MGVMESTSISPSSMRYRAPTFTWGRIHIRMLQVISPRRTPSRRRLVNSIGAVYTVLRNRLDDTERIDGIGAVIAAPRSLGVMLKINKWSEILIWRTHCGGVQKIWKR